MLLPQKFINDYLVQRASNNAIEVEIRFGKVYPANAINRSEKFESDVSYREFERLLARLREHNYPETSSVSKVHFMNHSIGEIRRITTVGSDKIEYERKVPVTGYPINLIEYDVRLAMSIEQVIMPPEKFIATDKERKRTRHSFVISNIVRVDMTRAKTTTKTKNEKVIRKTLEVELEYIGTEQGINEYAEIAAHVFRWLRGSELLYTNSIKNQLISDVEALNLPIDAAEILQLMRDRKRKKLAKEGKSTTGVDRFYFETGFLSSSVTREKYMVKARGLTKKDLVYGGLVGHPSTKYTVSHKVDGLRKLCITHATGTWLIFAPHEFNLLSAAPSTTISILDGEYTQTGHYIPFDTLVDHNEVVFSKDYLDRTNRMFKIGQEINTRLAANFFHYKTIEIINTVDDFYRVIPQMLDVNPGFLTDGLIFTPINVAYGNDYRVYPRTAEAGKLPDCLERRNKQVYGSKGSSSFLMTDVNQRSLSICPEVCKYKDTADITIDFEIRRVDGKIELYSYDEQADVMVKFTGNNIVSLTPDHVDHAAELTKNIPDGKIVEYKVINVKTNYLLTPVKPRFDKTGPNQLDVAQHNWGNIFNPLTVDIMRGNSFKLVFASHNRIKDGLYEFAKYEGDVLEIGFGRGQDATKLNKTGKHNKILAVEPSAENRDELFKRIAKTSLVDRLFVLPTVGEDTNNIVAALQQRETMGVIERNNKYRTGHVDTISLMLSLSFFWADAAKLDALVETIVSTIKPGGKIIFLTVNGDAVKEFIQPTYDDPDNQRQTTAVLGKGDNAVRLELLSDNTLQITIPESEIVGTQIEYLVHIDDLVLRLKKYGFSLKLFQRADDELFLSPPERLYTSLFSYGVFCHDAKINLPPQKYAMATTKISSNPFINPYSSISAFPRPGLPTTDTMVEYDQPTSAGPISKHLAALYVDASADGDEPAAGDDVKELIKCLWFENLYRLATIGDGKCFVHAVLKATDYIYQTQNSARARKNRCADICRDLAVNLELIDERFPLGQYRYWETADRGNLVRGFIRQTIDGILDSDFLDYGLRGVQGFLNSKAYLSDDIYGYISDVMNMDVYVFTINSDDISLYKAFTVDGQERDACIIAGNSNHYETVALQTPEGLQTVFPPDSELIMAIKSLEGFSYVTPFNPQIYDERFVELFVRETVRWNDAAGEYQYRPHPDLLPGAKHDVIARDDPFFLRFLSLRPRIEDAVQEAIVKRTAQRLSGGPLSR